MDRLGAKIERVFRRQERRQDGREIGMRFRRQRRQGNADVFAEIVRDAAERAGKGEDAEVTA